jgi:hypothetical protein
VIDILVVVDEMQYANERGRYVAEKVDVVSELLSEASRWRSRS